MTSHLAAKSGDVLTVRTPALWRCIRRSVPDRDPVQRIADHGQIVAAGFGHDQPLALAIEKLDAERGLQRFDLMAHGALRDIELFGRPRKAFAPRRGLEGLQGIQRWQAARHGSIFMRKTNNNDRRRSYLTSKIGSHSMYEIF